MHIFIHVRRYTNLIRALMHGSTTAVFYPLPRGPMQLCKTKSQINGRPTTKYFPDHSNHGSPRVARIGPRLPWHESAPSMPGDVSRGRAGYERAIPYTREATPLPTTPFSTIRSTNKVMHENDRLFGLQLR